MKKKHMFLIIILLIFCILFNKTKFEINKLSLNKTEHSNSNNKISRIIEQLNDYQDINGHTDSINYINIVPIKERINMMTVGIDWVRKMFILEFDEHNNLRLIDTEHGGLAEYFNPQIVNLSQGSFIEIFSVAHMPTGQFELVLTEPPYETVFIIKNVVDAYFQNLPIEEITLDINNEYIEKIENIEKARFSTIYDGGHLNVSYEDVNFDGNTDIVLRGVKKYLFHYEGENNNHIISERNIKWVYLYDEPKKIFLFDESLSVNH